MTFDPRDGDDHTDISQSQTEVRVGCGDAPSLKPSEPANVGEPSAAAPDANGGSRKGAGMNQDRSLCESIQHTARSVLARFCAVDRAPDGSILTHQHLCSVHARAEKLFGRANITPLTYCPAAGGDSAAQQLGIAEASR